MQKMVQKTLLKFYAYELVERVARFDMLTRNIWRDHQKISPAALASLETIQQEMNNTVLKNKNDLLQLFSEQETKKTTTPASLLKWGDSINTLLTKATAALQALTQPTALQEHELFTNEVFIPATSKGKPDELTQILGELSLILSAEPTPENALLNTSPTLSGISFSKTSVIQQCNPLGWTTGMNGFLNTIVQEQAASFKKVKKQINSIIPDAHACDAVIAAALGLKLMGPAYYFQTLADGLVQQSELTLCHIEPILFFGLNHYNTIEKSLIIAHESVDKTLPYFEMESAETQWTHPLLAELYKELDHLIPDRFTFSEKAFETAKKLKERVADGVLLSSSSCYTIQQLQEQLEEVRATGDDYSVYDVLTKTTEFPHTAKEIINAGWLHKMDRMSVWLYAVCEDSLNEPGEPSGLTRLTNILSRQDQLLLKSVDNAEVHRVLAYQL